MKNKWLHLGLAVVAGLALFISSNVHAAAKYLNAGEYLVNMDNINPFTFGFDSTFRLTVNADQSGKLTAVDVNSSDTGTTYYFANNAMTQTSLTIAANPDSSNYSASDNYLAYAINLSASQVQDLVNGKTFEMGYYDDDDQFVSDDISAGSVQRIYAFNSSRSLAHNVAAGTYHLNLTGGNYTDDTWLLTVNGDGSGYLKIDKDSSYAQASLGNIFLDVSDTTNSGYLTANLTAAQVRQVLAQKLLPLLLVSDDDDAPSYYTTTWRLDSVTRNGKTVDFNASTKKKAQKTAKKKTTKKKVAKKKTTKHSKKAKKHSKKHAKKTTKHSKKHAKKSKKHAKKHSKKHNKKHTKKH